MPTITIASFFFKPKNLASEGSESGPAKQPEDFSVPHNAEKIGSEIQGSQCEISTADSLGPLNTNIPFETKKEPKKETQCCGLSYCSRCNPNTDIDDLIEAMEEARDAKLRAWLDAPKNLSMEEARERAWLLMQRAWLDAPKK
jgi:hypothetical protein